MKQYIHNTFPVCLRFLCATMLVALSVTACQKEDETVTLDAVIADQPNRSAKVYVNSFYSYWHNGDKVYINGNTSDDKYTLSVTKASPVIAKIEDVETSTKYTAGYPAEYTEITGNGSLNITLPETQTYELGQIYSNDAADKAQSIVTPMAAYTEGTTLRFHNVGALIKVEIENKINQTMTLYAVEVESDKAPLSGTLAVTATEGGVSIGTTTDGKKRVSMRFSGSDNVVLDASSGDGTKTATIYIPILSIAETQKSNLTVHVMATGGDSKKYTFHGESAAEQGVWIARNAMGSISCELNTTTCSGENAYFWGKGTPECPYMIENETDLKKLRDLVCSSESSDQSTYNVNTVYYLQTNELDISDQTTWGKTSSTTNYAIGYSDKPFKANYNGGGYGVKLGIGNLNSDVAANTGVGLFGTVGGGGSIKKLTVTGSIAAISRNIYVGGIAGHVKGAFTIEKCRNDVSMEIYYDGVTSYTQYYGGVCGNIEAGSGMSVSITDCYNNGSIINNKNGMIGGICGYITSGSVTFTRDTNAAYVGGASGGNAYGIGGICGRCASTGISITFSYCINQGQVEAICEDMSTYVGGIMGYVYCPATFSYCVNKILKVNDVTVNTVSGKGYVGGIVGYIMSAGTSLENCDNDGKITGTGSNVGGIIGQSSASCTVSSCINNGIVSSSSSSVGGIVGYASNAITFSGCENTSLATVSGSNKIGGVLGEHGSIGKASASDCINNGTVTSTTTDAGGIIGASSGTVGFDECENHGNISGTTRIGGVIGYISYSNDASQTELTSCSNSGKISGSGNNGGFIGESTHNIVFSDCMNEGTISSTGINIGGFIGLNKKMTEFVSCENKGDNKTTITPTNEYDIQSSSTSSDNNVGGFGGQLTKSRFTNCTNSASVYGYTSVGGLCGNTADFVVDKCENTGHIYGKKSGNYDCKVGGILGYVYNTSSSSYEIKNSVNRGSVTGLGKEVGGIVGYLRAAGARIKNCYSTGAISGAYPKTAGGIFGYTYDQSSFTVENCYVILSSSTSSCARTIYGNDSRITPTVTNCYDNSNSGITSNANYSYSVSTNQETEGQYITTNSSKKLLVALNDWQSSHTSYCTWTTTTKDALGNPIYTELPILSWEDPASKRR